MRTYSHFLMTAVADSLLRQRGVETRPTAFLLGSVLPDVPLLMLGTGLALQKFGFAPLVGLAPWPTLQSLRPLLDAMYFHHPVWVVGHSLLHAPLSIGVLAVLGLWLIKRQSRWGASLLWFALGCGLHALVDILTHHTDGPLLLFPFNWHVRFASPISYWDVAHHGGPLTHFEHWLNGLWLAYLGWRRLRLAWPLWLEKVRALLAHQSLA